MSDHYYSEKPTVESDRRKLSFSLRGGSFHFFSDRGVFSKGDIDFGSQLLIEEFQFPEVNGKILDMGCGYGPIGITLAKEKNERELFLVDVNERAIQLAKDNAAMNGVSNVRIFQSNLFEKVEPKDFAAIISNPPIRAGKQVIFELYEKANEHLAPGGELWIVIQKKQGAPSTIEKLEQLFGEVETVAKKKGYYIIKAKKV